MSLWSKLVQQQVNSGQHQADTETGERNNRNRSSNNDRMANEGKLIAKRAAIAGCVCVLLIIIGILAASLKKVEETEYGLMYTTWSKRLDEEAVSGGLFVGPPGFKFVKFPSTFVTVNLDDRQCVSRDGLIVSFSVTFQYQMIAENMFPATERYRDFYGWNEIVTEAGVSAIHHSCAEFTITNFQTKRGEIQEEMLSNLRVKLEGNTTAGIEGVYAQAASLQLRYLGIPSEYKDAVKEKQSAEEDIALAKNQRQQETTKAKTALLRAQEEARKIRDTANNDVEIMLTEAKLSAQETTFAFEQEAVTIVNIKDSLGLSTNGVLAYLANGLLEDVDNLKVTTLEPARLSRSQELSSSATVVVPAA